MLFEDRISLILKLIEQNGSIENSKIIKDLKISEATLRRDLAYLEKEGKIKRVRGGAILKKVARKEIAIKEKNFNKDSKKKIAKLAAQFISDGDYIYLDAGTTTYEIIDYIKGKDIKVVTNGIIHLEKLIANDIETYLIGGRIKKSTLAIVGVKALRDLSEFRFDKAFIGINGINENGYSTHDIEEALIKKQAIDNSNKAFILADSSKFDIVYFANVAKLEEATLANKKDLAFTATESADVLTSLLDASATLVEQGGSFIFTYKTLAQIKKHALKAGANGPLAEIFITGDIPRIFGIPYIVVPNDLMPALESEETVTIPVNGKGVSITHAIFYADLKEFIGFTNEGLQFEVATGVAYETTAGTVKSGFSRGETVIRGSMFRGGAFRDITKATGILRKGLTKAA